MPSVRVMCKVYPTEDESKLFELLHQLFPEMQFERRGDWIVGEGDISHLNNLLHMIARQGIAPRALEVVKQRRRGKNVVIPIDREAATAGQLSLSDEEGEFSPIWVEVDDASALISLLESLVPADVLSCNKGSAAQGERLSREGGKEPHDIDNY